MEWEEAGHKSSILKPREAVGTVTGGGPLLFRVTWFREQAKLSRLRFFIWQKAKPQEDVKETEALLWVLKGRPAWGPRYAQHHRDDTLAPCLPSS